MPTRNGVNYKKDKPKDIHTKTDNRFMKTNIKEEILNAASDISLGYRPQKRPGQSAQEPQQRYDHIICHGYLTSIWT